MQNGDQCKTPEQISTRRWILQESEQNCETSGEFEYFKGVFGPSAKFQPLKAVSKGLTRPTITAAQEVSKALSNKSQETRRCEHFRGGLFPCESHLEV